MGLNQIIADCKKNNPKAQEQLYQLFAKKFFGVCLKYSRNYDDAQDNLQDGFIIIVSNGKSFSETCNIWSIKISEPVKITYFSFSCSIWSCKHLPLLF